jgi:hypothetical protein
MLHGLRFMQVYGMAGREQAAFVFWCVSDLALRVDRCRQDRNLEQL